MIQILFEKDHENRAITLTNNLKRSGHAVESALIDKTASAKNLDTLIFWGHGTSGFLCGKTPKQLTTIIKAWKRVNSRLATVEVITCDARHGDNNDPSSYVEKLKKELKSGFFSSTKSIILKALPVFTEGANKGASILLADWQTQSWAYIATPKPAESHGGFFTVKNKIIKIADENFTAKVQNPNESDMALIQGQDLVHTVLNTRRSAKTFEKQQPQIKFGYFDTLRANLIVV